MDITLLSENNSLKVKNIRDGDEFYKWLFDSVPDDSILYVEGMLGGNKKKAYAKLNEFSITDDIELPRGTIWPRQPTAKLLLSNFNKPKLLSLFKDPTFGYRQAKFPFDHSFIYYKSKILMQSFDNLEYVWISKDFPHRTVNQAVTDKLFELSSD